MDFRDIVEFFKDTFKYILVFVIAVLLVIYVIGFHQIIGPSMNPLLKENDVTLVNKFIYHFRDIKRSEVVVLKQDEKTMVKRIIGLPGESIKYDDNKLYVNDIIVEEAYLKDTTTYDFNLSELNYEKIPEDLYLVLGDNRLDSDDSRTFGLVKKEKIMGKVILVILPFKSIKIVK